MTLGLGSERRRWRREAERSRRGPGPRQETARREVAISEANQSNHGLLIEWNTSTYLNITE